MDVRKLHAWLKCTFLWNVALWLSRCFCLRSLQGMTLGSFGSMTPTCWMIRSGLVENTKGFSSSPPTWWENTWPCPTQHYQQQQQKQPLSCPRESDLRRLFSFKTNLNGGSFLRSSPKSLWFFTVYAYNLRAVFIFIISVDLLCSNLPTTTKNNNAGKICLQFASEAETFPEDYQLFFKKEWGGCFRVRPSLICKVNSAVSLSLTIQSLNKQNYITSGMQRTKVTLTAPCLCFCNIPSCVLINKSKFYCSWKKKNEWRLFLLQRLAEFPWTNKLKC